MGLRKKHLPVKFFAGLIFKDEQVYDRCRAVLLKAFGESDLASPVFPFIHTSYYEKEFGTSLKKAFISFKRLIPVQSLPDIKIRTNALEQKYSLYEKRRINIDPGYLTLAKIVLATTKDYSHRIFLGKGIFGESTLVFRNNSFIPWEWTYPDFRAPEYLSFYNELRRIYAKQISHM
jgi:hypothetical protein